MNTLEVASYLSTTVRVPHVLLAYVTLVLYSTAFMLTTFVRLAWGCPVLLLSVHAQEY